MAQGRTLWQMFTDWAHGPRELGVFNPLKAQVGRSIAIDDIDWRDHSFMLTGVRQYKRTIEMREFTFIDYVLYERSLQGVEMTIRIRLNPAENAYYTGQMNQALLLTMEDDMAYNEGLHQVLKDPSGIFRIENDGKVTAEFNRLGGLKEPYKAEVTVMIDEDHDKRVAKDEVSVDNIEYWDFARDVPDAAGQMQKEFLFAEMDTSNGWMQLWRGKEIDPNKIAVM
jgi:hypothetical protein